MRKPTKSDCSGCHNDVYNHQDFGMNMKDGSPECWSLQTAELVKARDVHRDLPPPYLHLPLTVWPSCFKAREHVRVKPESLDSKGYWR